MKNGIEADLKGSVRRYDYDSVNKLQKIDLFDAENNLSFYIEIPIRIVDLKEQSSLSIRIEPEKGQEIDFSSITTLLNADLYSVKQTDTENKYFFSAGGLQFRIVSEADLGFRMREQRQYKILVK
ncbi:MAG: hypothetical protein ACTSRU_15625 [Candidatus Hodarchaeales archaeon]